ncbi:hypothetical protein GCM10007384_36430 [Aquimarina muelleri]|uniref:Uncharacterized protein n=1 Tax=Aquimarina muelleri TaxID=279356 RepID=A0A918N4T2_9FLAO|nr:hypothetical protein GCM10007384_36430 [Aquimarina muelleri]
MEKEPHHPGYLGCQDIYYVSSIKSIGRIYVQASIDTLLQSSFCKILGSKKYYYKN